MHKFVFNYRLKTQNKSFFKNISFNFLVFSKIYNFKKFHKICNILFSNMYTLNFGLLIFYNQSSSYLIIRQLISLLVNCIFLCNKNIFLKRYFYNYIICSISNIIKFHEFILHELVNYKNYIYPYILVNSNLITLNNYVYLFKMLLKRGVTINNNFFVIIVRRIMYLFYLIKYFFTFFLEKNYANI